VVDEEMRFSIVVNGDPAQKELHKLEASTRTLTSTNKKLRAERDKLRAQGKQNTAQYKKLSASIKQNNAELVSNKARMKELQNQIGVTGLTMAQLQKRAAQLRLQLRNMVPGSAQYKKLQADLAATKSRVRELSTQANAARLSIGGIADGFSRYAALGATIIATTTGIALSFSKLIDFQGELSDAQADVQKTTGLTKDEVAQLTKELGALDTRSSRMELLALSEEAGRLGITGVANIQGFVETANKLKVALGDELSDEAIREVGKMTNIFKVGEQTGRDFETSMESLGSAINQVSASGANTAGFLVDFMKRTAGVADVANIQAGEIIGIAAAFDELGQSQETSATAINKTLLSMGKDVAAFANVANMSIGDFSKLLEEDANEALIVFLEALNQGNPTMETMAKRLEGIEVGGTRGVQSIAALASNTELLRKRQLQANDAMLENSSLADEYNLKNENTAAILLKIRRRMMAIFASTTITNGIADLLNWFAKFIGATEDADGGVTRFRDRLMLLLKALAVLIISVFSYNSALLLTSLVTKTAATAQMLLNLVQNKGAIASNLLRSSVLLLNAVYLLFTGNITRAAAAMRLFNFVVKANPLGLLLTVLSGVIAYFILFKDEVKEVEKEIKQVSSATDVLRERNAELSASFAKESVKIISKVKPLIEILKDQNVELDTRKLAYQKLISISPEFIGTVNDEYIAVEDLTIIYDSLLTKLEQKLRAQANEKVMGKFYDAEAEALARVVELESELAELRSKREEKDESLTDNPNLESEILGKELILLAAKNKLLQEQEKLKFFEGFRNTELVRLQNLLKTLKEGSAEYIRVQLEIESLIGAVISGELVSPGGRSGGLNSTIDKSDLKLANLKAELQALNKLRKENYDLEIEQLDDKFFVEMQLLESNHEEKLRMLQSQKTEEAEILLTQGFLDQAIAQGNREAIDNYSQVLEIWATKNKEVDERIRLEKIAHQAEMGEVIQNGINREIQLLEEGYKRQQVILEQERLKQLTEVANSEVATQALKDKFRREDLQSEKEHIQNIQEMVNGILNSNNFEGFNMELLTEEQKQQVIARLQELGLEIEQINLLLAQMQGGGSSTDVLGSLGLGGQTDIFGFTPDNWMQMIDNFSNLKNILESTVMVFGAMSQAYGMFVDFQNQRDQQRLRNFEQNNQAEKTKLQQRLDAGYISEKQYADAVSSLDAELDEKKAKIEEQQREREQKAAIARILTDTAVAAIRVWANPGFPMAIPLSALIAAQAGLQLANVRASGYEDGFYGDKFPVQRSQDGKMFNASFGGESKSGIVDQPTVFLAGEQGKSAPEMIISGQDWTAMNPAIKDSVSREIGRVRGFQDGMYSETDSNQSAQMEALIQLNIATLTQLNDVLQKGILAKVISNEANARELQESLDKFRKRKESSKI